MSLEESVRTVVREEMKRVLREELRAAIEELRGLPSAAEKEFLSVKACNDAAKAR